VVVCEAALRQNVKRATNWPDLGFAPAPATLFTNPKPEDNAPAWPLAKVLPNAGAVVLETIDGVE